jgi:phosphate starvation-inducible protein PhoH
MSDARKPKFKQAAEEPVPPKVDLRSEPQSAPDKPLGPEQVYLKRKAEVTQQDNEAFAEYLQEKRARDERQQVQVLDPPQRKPLKVNRRSLLTWAAGTAVVGEAATLGYPMLTGQKIPPLPTAPSGIRPAAGPRPS